MRTPDEAIEFLEEGIHLSITFPPESTWRGFQPSAEEILRTHNNHAHRVMIEVKVEISQPLADHMMDIHREVGPIADEYKELGRNLQKLLMKRINRLLAYARSVKGQFWLDELEPDHLNPGQFFLRNNASASIDDKSIGFDPDHRTIALTGFATELELMLTAQDWPAVREFVIGERRPPLIGTLLANARHLAEQGSRRNALVEAVTALDVALSNFSRRADAGKLERFRPGLEVTSIGPLIEKAGLRGSFGIVIPLLFSEVEFPASLLETCRGAIEQRNNVVHRGARDVDGIQLTRMILAIERSCRILANHADPSDND
jgi:hypothetical protein